MLCLDPKAHYKLERLGPGFSNATTAAAATAAGKKITYVFLVVSFL